MRLSASRPSAADARSQLDTGEQCDVGGDDDVVCGRLDVDGGGDAYAGHDDSREARRRDGDGDGERRRSVDVGGHWRRVAVVAVGRARACSEQRAGGSNDEVCARIATTCVTNDVAAATFTRRPSCR